MTDLDAFIAGLPKVELHVHHVGSASPRIVAELAARHEGATPVPADPEALASYFEFRDFAHFVEIYLSVVDLIRDAEDVRILTYEVARELARQQVRYAELTVTPYSHVQRGIPAPEFCAAIEDARRHAEAELGVVLRWCFDIPGEAGLAAAERDAADRARTSGRTGWSASASAVRRSACPDRSSRRTSTPPGRPACTRCRTPARPPARRRSGTRCSTSAPSGSATASPRRATRSCWSTWPSTGIPLEVCPTSNLRTRAVTSLDEHPLPRFVEAGVPVTHQLRRPADVRHHAQPGVRGRRQTARPGRGGAWPGWPGPR